MPIQFRFDPDFDLFLASRDDFPLNVDQQSAKADAFNALPAVIFKRLRRRTAGRHPLPDESGLPRSPVPDLLVFTISSVSGFSLWQGFAAMSANTSLKPL